MASPESSLEQGLAALQQGDYKNAIAYLEAICQTENQSACQFEACQGLVVAYQHTGNIAKAIAVCETLINSSNPQVQVWASNQLELAVNTANDLTGFLSFNPNKKHQVKKHSTGGAASENPQPQWRQAGRAKKWQLLPKINLFPLWLLEIGTAIALFWLVRELVKLAMSFTNAVLVKLPYLQPLQLFYRDPTALILLTLGILIGLSPWLLDRLLQVFYNLQPLSINTLSSYSPETVRVLNRYCRQQHWSLPKLFILPTLAPVALTYGNLPRTARIVVSQGLLEQLTTDEIATIYASQLGHITHWDFVVMSLVMLVTQLPYIIYWQVSAWGDNVTNQILQTIAAAIACCAYGIWYILSAVSIWLSQLRIYYSDRLATEITGNPNGLTTALLKITRGIANDIQQQGHTSWLLESCNLLTIIGYQQAITLGSLPATTQFESVLAWDCLNPHRYWLNINNTHPLIGDRLQRLAQIAATWHLETALYLPKSRSKESLPLHPFFLQAAPLLGILLGFAFGVLTWLLGGIGILFNSQLAWMFGDWIIIKGCLPIGFSIGTLIRINAFFPDLKPATLPKEPILPYLLANPTALPVNTQPIRLQGKLLARSGISNYLGQDFILSSPSGLVKLHHIPLFTIARIKSEQALSLKNLGNKDLIATGWFRRGATPWIDIDTLHTQGKASYSNHPLWSTLLAGAAAIWGVYIIWQGEF